MAIIFGVAAGCIVLGLLMVFMHTSLNRTPMLATVVHWVGVVLVVIGLVLLLTPVLIWVNAQLRQMLGVT
jgi:hypothetical protein